MSIGRITGAGLTFNFLVDAATVEWFTDTKILGATLGFAAVVPFGSERTAASVSFIGPLGANRTIGGTEIVDALGDSAFSASLGWEAGEHHWNLTLTGFAPTGFYSSTALAVLGLNRPAIDIKGATVLLVKRGLAAMGVYL